MGDHSLCWINFWTSPLQFPCAWRISTQWFKIESVSFSSLTLPSQDELGRPPLCSQRHQGHNYWSQCLFTEPSPWVRFCPMSWGHSIAPLRLSWGGRNIYTPTAWSAQVSTGKPSGAQRGQQDTHSIGVLRSAGSAPKWEEDLREVNTMRRRGLEKKEFIV